VLLIGAGLLAHLPGFGHQLFDSDEAAIATVGNVVAHGGVLYRDAIDRKPPLAPLLYAASFTVTGSRDLRPLHVLVGLELAGAAFVLALEARRVAGRRSGWWAAGLLIAGAVAFRPVAGQAANYSQLALLPACGAIVCARRGTTRNAVAAGALLGLAILTRQTWILGLVPATAAAWLHGGRRPSRPLLVVLGVALTIAAVVLIAPFGDFWRWTFSGNASLLSPAGSTSVWPRFARTLWPFLAGHIAICLLVIRRGLHRDDMDLWLWLFTGLVAVVAGFRFFDHYWFQVLPPVCLLAAFAIDRVNLPGRILLIGLVALPTVVFWSSAWTTTAFSNSWSPVVSFISKHTRPTDRVAVWGSVPEIYWRSGRSPGGAMVTTDFVVGRSAGHPDGPQRLRAASPGALDQYMQSLYAHPPRLFLDTAPASIRGYGHYPLTVEPRVSRFVDSYYRALSTVDRVTVYQLEGRPPAREPASREP
jgi:hypothetical protein